jgi:hypothetical protein
MIVMMEDPWREKFDLLMTEVFKTVLIIGHGFHSDLLMLRKETQDVEFRKEITKIVDIQEIF